jgi:peptidyl-prolyl cis-trans isomerase D
MISYLRRVFVDSRAGRAIAFLLFLALVGWGMGDVFTNFSGSNPDTVAKIGKRKVTAEQIAGALRNQLPQTARQMGLSDPSQLPEAARAQAARQVLQQFVTQNEVLLAAQKAGMKAPDALVRDEIYSYSFFKGPNGQFDRALFNQRLSQIGMTERTLIEQVRDDLTVRGLLDGIGNAAHAPAGMVDRLIAFNTRIRHVDMVKVTPDQTPITATPSDAQLRRFYDNHPWAFRTTEYRHAKIVALTLDSVARSIETPDADLRRLYDFQARRFHVPETRSLQVATMPSEARARAIAAEWQGGADWSKIEADAHDGATVDFPNARQTDIPNPELAAAAFKAQAGALQGPVKSETGWLVFKVSSIAAPHDTSFEDARQGLHDEIVKQQAPGLLHARAQQFEDAVAGSDTLEAIPDNLGAVAAAGALDANGNTHDGTPAPIPGDTALRQAIVSRIFSQDLHARPTVVQGPGNASFAVVVDEVSPGTLLPFDQVRDRVLSAWQEDARRDAANRHATALLLAGRQGRLVDTASTGDSSGLSISRDLTISRMRPDPNLSQDVLRAILAMKPGQAAMVEADGAFYVAAVTAYSDAPAAELTAIRQQIGNSLDQSVQSDVPMAYVAGLEQTTRPDINFHALDAVVQQSGPQAAGAAQ